MTVRREAGDESRYSAGAGDGCELSVEARFGYLRVGLEHDSKPLFEIPEWLEPDRRRVHAATVGVRTSAPRAVENFLDMSHFPFVHTSILGEEPHIEVHEYDVSLDEEAGEILATNCRFQQPRAAVGSTGAMLVPTIEALDRATARTLWYPVAASADLLPRHVFQGRLLGRELALWRADDGGVNAWEKAA